MAHLGDIRAAMVVVAAFALPATASADAAPAERPRANVSVFNFQLTTETPDWAWLEKFLADRITTDFVRSGGVSVVARDDMQSLARQLKWVPEMATASADATGRIKQALKIAHLVSGTAAVKDDQVEITAQIVDVADRRERFRKTVRGKTDAVLELQRQLSAELLGWLTRRPAGEILPALPVWTKSIPAARALYVGMDLYDQGSYAEAWLSFRQAARADAEYLDAAYWVGKMDFLMGRYAHARLAVEPFLRITGDAPHPRILDAARVYAACLSVGEADLEKRLAAARKALHVARQVSRREGWRQAGEMAEEFTDECAYLLALLGRYGEAADLAGPGWDPAGVHRPAAALNLCAHHALTGEVPTSEAVTTTPERDLLVGVAPGAGVRRLKNQRILGKSRHNLDLRAAFDPTATGDSLLLAARNGYVVKSVRFVPVTEGGREARLSASLFDPCCKTTVLANAEVPLGDVPEGGLRVEPPIPAGIFRVGWSIALTDEENGPPIVVREMRVLPELVKLGPHGSIDVACPDTPNFRVEIDARFVRNWPGLVGPLPPGEYTVTLRPIEEGSPHRPWTKRVRVEAGKTTPVTGSMPFLAGGPMPGWTITPVQPQRRAYRSEDRTADPAIYADDEGIRLLWTQHGDIWTAFSRDGKQFAAPRPVGLPVSTPWVELEPKCLRDESGRYLLLFRSDRGDAGPSAVYLAWSRDFVHWSKPVRLADMGMVRCFDACFDDRGRIVLVCATHDGTRPRLRVFAGSEGAQFVELGDAAWPRQCQDMSAPRILQRDDGRFEMYLTYEARIVEGERYPVCRLVKYASSDGRRWQGPEELWRSRHLGRCAAGVEAGRTFVGLAPSDLRTPNAPMVLLGETDGGFDRAEIEGVVRNDLAMAWHPRWGAMILWGMPSGHPWMPHRPYGPFLLRGKSFAELVSPGEPAGDDKGVGK